jgi:3-oxoadipate enol-lactonase
VPFFDERPDDAAAFEGEMAAMTMTVDAYLAQLEVIRTHDATDRLGTLAVPTLVLAGEEDILIPVRLSRRLQGLVPGAEWATTKGGHACMWEHPEAFNATYLDYLARH